MKIYVTQEHIAEGKPGRCLSCPIALALKAAGIWPCHVYGSLILYANRYVDLPTEAVRFINAFDAGRQVSPLSFELEMAPQSNTAA